MKIVASGLSHDQHLRPRPLSVLGAIRIAQHVELAHGVDAQQLLAGAARLHIVLGRAGELDAVEQEQILLRTIAVRRRNYFHWWNSIRRFRRFFPR